MKREVNRLVNSVLFWCILIFGFAVILWRSVVYYRASGEPLSYWQHGIEAYSTEEELAAQIAQWEETREAAKTVGDEEAAQYAGETLRICQYLKRERIPYDSVMEMSALTGNAESKLGYATTQISDIYILLLLCACILSCSIVNAEKNNGAYRILFLMEKRASIYREKILSYYAVLSVFLLLFFALLTLIRREFPADKLWLLIMENDGGINHIRETEYFIRMLFSLVVLYLPATFLCIAFSLLIDNIFLSFAVQAGVCFVLISLPGFFPGNRILAGWNYLACNFKMNQITVAEFAILNLIKFFLAIGVFVFAYRRAVRKDLTI